jgi:heterotetrameric sarcosine oxidase delta subunit
MRLDCPFCGSRDAQEFTCLGDATLHRPDGLAADAEAMFGYVYLRDNPRGRHHELWYHAAGCHAWLVVERDTLTHAIHGVTLAANRASAGAPERGA